MTEEILLSELQVNNEVYYDGTFCLIEMYDIKQNSKWCVSKYQS